MSIEYREEAIAELSKSMRLAVEGHKIHMFSGYIDSVWHTLLSNESDYGKFSMEACGYIILHSESDGRGVPRFKDAYEAKYGKFPKIWFRDEEGVLNHELFENYEKIGEILASWKCSATHNCMFRIKNQSEKNNPKEDKKEQPAQSEAAEDRQKNSRQKLP